MTQKRYLFPADYMADPAVHVFNGKIFIYPSHDWEAGAEEDDDGGHFQMKDYHALFRCERCALGRKTVVGQRRG